MEDKLDKVLPLFKDYLLVRAHLNFTKEQELLLLTHIWKDPKFKKDFSKVQTCFFNYFKLKKGLIKSLWKYGLSKSELEAQVEEKNVIPFAALNCDGLTIKYGDDPFAEMMNWGVLCLDLTKGSDVDSPVIWVYKGQMIPWSDGASSFKVDIIRKG